MHIKGEKTVLWAALFALTILTYWTIFSSERLPGGDMSDTVSQGYPFFSYTEARLSRGEIPMWNPYIFCGVPFYSSFSSPVFYPLRGLPLILFGSEAAIRSLFPVHMLLAGLFAWLFLKATGVSRWGSLAGSFAYASGAWANTLFYAGHGSKVICWAWLPLLLWAVVRWAKSSDSRYIGFGAIAIGMQGLSSHPQMILYSAGCALVLSLFLLKKPLSSSVFANIGGLTAIFLLGGALAAVQLYPGYLFSQNTSRGEDLSIEAAASYSLPPEETLTMVFPGMFGLRHGFSDSSVNGIPVYFGRLGLRLSSEFIGVAFFILGVFGFAYGRDKKTRMALLTLSILGTVVSWGGYTPVFSVLYKLLPVFRKLRAPHMAAFVTTSSIALASGMGFDALFCFDDKGNRTNRMLKVLAALSVAFLLLMLAAAPVSNALQASWWNRAGVSDSSPYSLVVNGRASLLSTDFLRASAVTGVMAFLLYLLRKKKGSAGLFALSVLAISSLELIPFNRGFQVFLPYTRIETMYPDAPLLREMAGTGRVFPGGNELIPLEIRSVSGYHAAKPAVTDRLLALLGSSSPWIIRQTAITAFASTEGAMGWDQIQPALAQDTPGFPIDPMPRAFIPRSVASGSMNDGFDALEGGINPQIRSIVQDTPSIHDGVQGNAEILIDLPELVRIKTVTSTDGFLILADTWYPNWEATVDGNRIEVYKANGWMRGVPVPNGEHIVEFTYNSDDVVLGGIISASVLLLILGIILFPARKRPNA